MARLKWKPGHPMADKDGWVNEQDYNEFNKMYADMYDDLRMTVGNQKVYIHYISDEMAPTRHMCNNKYYTSKKKFRDETRARGCIEIGNETDYLLKPRQPIGLDRRQRAEDIKRAIYELRNGRNIKNEVKEAHSKSDF